MAGLFADDLGVHGGVVARMTIRCAERWLVWGLIVSFGLVMVGVVVLFRLIRGLVLGFLGLSWLLEILVVFFAWFVLSVGCPPQLV